MSRLFAPWVALPLMSFLSVSVVADGDLDPSFGDEGQVTLNYFGLEITARTLALLPDGKILIGGSTWDAGHTNLALLRLNPDGDRDLGFGLGGLVITDFGGANEFTFEMALQPDGKILIAGRISEAEPASSALVVRYDPDGVLDTSFGQGGRAQVDFGALGASAGALALQQDGKIVIGGSVVYPEMRYDFALARLDANGALDPTFGQGGKVTTRFSSGDSVIEDLLVAPDETILAVGPTGSTYGVAALARYLVDGRLDSSFGDGGIVQDDLDGRGAGFTTVELQEDGRILVGAGLYDSSSFAVARYLPDGRRDPAFDLDGVAETYLSGTTAVVRDLAIQSDGKILAARDFDNGSTDFLTLSQYFRDGSLDLSFGSSGVVMTDFPNLSAGLGAIALLPDGRIVAVGAAFNSTSILPVAARYLAEPVGTTDYFLEVLPDQVGPGAAVQVAVGLVESPVSVPPYTIEVNPGSIERTLTPGDLQFLDPPIPIATSASISLDPLPPAEDHLERGVQSVHYFYDGSLAIRALAPGAPGALVRDPHIGPGSPLTIVAATAPAPEPARYDLYAAVILPTGQAFSLLGNNTFGSAGAILPFAGNVTLENRLYPLASLESLPAGLPLGHYLLLVASAPPGADVLTQYRVLTGATFTVR